MAKSGISALMEKAASLLEIQADALDEQATQKTAAVREEKLERLRPVIAGLEAKKGEKLASEEIEELLQTPETVMDIVASMSGSKTASVGFGGPERPRTPKIDDTAPKPIGSHPYGSREPVRRGTRRSAEQIAAQSRRQEKKALEKYNR